MDIYIKINGYVSVYKYEVSLQEVEKFTLIYISQWIYLKWPQPQQGPKQAYMAYKSRLNIIAEDY